MTNFKKLDRMRLAADSIEAHGFKKTAQALHKVIDGETGAGQIALAVLEDPLFKNAADTLSQLEIMCAVVGAAPKGTLPDNVRMLLADARLAIARSKGEES